MNLDGPEYDQPIFVWERNPGRVNKLILCKLLLSTPAEAHVFTDEHTRYS